MIKHFVPTSLDEALDILATNDCYIMAGGTDLMVQKHVYSGLLPRFDKDVIYINDLKELNFVREESDGLHIGATTKYIDILKSEYLPPLLRDIILEIASPNIRNMATLAGNIANASPAGDSLVGLYLYDAYLVLKSKSGERKLKVQDFILGVRKIDKRDDELISEIIIPHQNLVYYYKKVGSRKAETISKLSFAGAYHIEEGKIADLRIAFGSVSTTVIRDRKVEEKYIGLTIDELKGKVDSIVNRYEKLIKPITDQRSTKDYRKKVSLNLLKDFILKIKE